MGQLPKSGHGSDGQSGLRHYGRATTSRVRPTTDFRCAGVSSEWRSDLGRPLAESLQSRLHGVSGSRLARVVIDSKPIQRTSTMIVEQIWTANNYRNFNYLIVDPDTGEALAVDPLDHQKCLAAAKDHGWTITQILNTHEHGDHTGGNGAVIAATGAKLL